MAYLGNNNLPFDPMRTNATPRDAERFSGNGSTVTFTLSRAVNSAVDCEVFVENVQQEPIVAYDIVANQLTFTEAPPSGTYNVYVVYRAVQVVQATLPDGSVSYNKLANNIRLFTVDNYIANSSISTYALSEAPADANTLAVSIDGIVQRAPINYTTTANTITFTSAPPTGANVHIKHLGFRSSSVVTAIPAGTTITQPILSNPTITLAAEGSSFKGNVALFDAAGTNRVGQIGATAAGQFQIDVGANTVSVRASTIALANVTAFSVANTSGALGLSVDAGARVTMPYQPSFFVGKNNINPFVGPATVTFNSVTFNIGSHYNSTNGIFTAPVAGRYFFSAILTSASGVDDIIFGIYVNGSAKMQFASQTSVQAGQEIAGCVSGILNLAVNDQVTVYTDRNLRTDSISNNTFSGHFLG
jgi:hypothetical protein